MTVRTIAALEAQIAAAIPDNSSGDVSPADVRNVLLDIVDSLRAERGWVDYVDTTYMEGSPLAVLASTDTVVPIDAGTIVDTYASANIGAIYTPASLAYDNETTAFTVGETVTGGTSGATAEIRHVSVDSGGTYGRLFLGPITGTFTDNEAITDGAGGAALADGSNDTGRIVGRAGSSVIATLDFKAKPSSANTTYLDTWIDIGGAVGELYRRPVSFPKGNGVERQVVHSTFMYQLDTWGLNGAEIYVNANGTFDMYDARIVLAELSAAVS